MERGKSKIGPSFGLNVRKSLHFDRRVPGLAQSVKDIGPRMW